MDDIIHQQDKLFVMKVERIVLKGDHIVSLDLVGDKSYLHEEFKEDKYREVLIDSHLKVFKGNEFLNSEDRKLYHITSVIVDGYLSNINLYSNFVNCSEAVPKYRGFMLSDEMLNYFLNESKREVYFITKRR